MYYKPRTKLKGSAKYILKTDYNSQQNFLFPPKIVKGEKGRKTSEKRPIPTTKFGTTSVPENLEHLLFPVAHHLRQKNAKKSKF